MSVVVHLDGVHILWIMAIGNLWIGNTFLSKGGAAHRSNQSAMSSSCSEVLDASYSYMDGCVKLNTDAQPLLTAWAS